MRELNIIEVSKMPNGEFEVYYPKGKKRDSILKTDLYGNLMDCDGTPFKGAYYNDIIQAKFIPIQKPVSFMEAVTSGKNISYRHEEAIFSEGNFGDIYDVLETLIECNSKDSIIKILSSECWYIEN